jgi:hypothetical protein
MIAYGRVPYASVMLATAQINLGDLPNPGLQRWALSALCSPPCGRSAQNVDAATNARRRNVRNGTWPRPG